ncbi:unnamed protein product [Didymodactylos carnosus]|uniref:Uncharacterized protein n=1 Tax=Didymodactylos carnosus TaxID=1234261 RepID=A0A813QHG6_9BILA|nr:unnamed protein product [Didymodactylos carnosus]CAF0819571.1 unnamed protein product [Didymodactylos carnosus]CAF3549375.1 unnamed protein product [Didymodactylos carnosus]CAF3603759.1 unnamed protein product [Didymodactylos carnosus]
MFLLCCSFTVTVSIGNHGILVTDPKTNITTYHTDEAPDKYYVTHEAWFDIVIMDDKLSAVPIKKQRIIIGLFGEICPMTVTNFVTITKGLRRGADFVYELGELETFRGTSIPKKHVEILDCGLNDITKYELTNEQLNAYSDVFASS